MGIETAILDRRSVMTNHCTQCGASLTVYADDCNQVVAAQDETECCCGDLDEFGNHTNASCVKCCTCKHGQQIWEGKNAGGGYYIVNPSF